MKADDIRRVVLEALAAVAPEADLERLDPSADLREALDLDSMDLLRFATALDARLGVDVPESEYAQITTLASCLSYLGRRLSPA